MSARALTILLRSRSPGYSLFSLSREAGGVTDTVRLTGVVVRGIKGASVGVGSYICIMHYINKKTIYCLQKSYVLGPKRPKTGSGYSAVYA